MSHRRAKKIRAFYGNSKAALSDPGTHFVLDGFKPGTGYYVTNTARHPVGSSRNIYQLVKKGERPNVRSQQP